MKKEDNRSEDQAKAQIESIVEMIAELELAEAKQSNRDREDALETIQEDPLSVQVRGDWHNPGDKDEAVEFRILLCTGGPAVHIVGELDKNNDPLNPKVEHQDWFTPWIGYDKMTEEQEKALLRYCSCFYFGE